MCTLKIIRERSKKKLKGDEKLWNQAQVDGTNEHKNEM